MTIKKLTPAIKRPIWSGEKISKWNKGLNGKIGETWELSFIEHSPSLINGEPVSTQIKKEEWGSACAQFEKFPLLIKFIDAQDNLSVQVHPDSDYAKRNGYLDGKTEAWYIVESEEGSGIFLGFNRKTSKEEVERRAKDGSIEEILNFIPTKKGDCFFVKSGCVHAIGKGVTIAEIQQSSDVTFRVYDYNRTDANGNKRELHLAQALQVLDYDRFEKVQSFTKKGSLQTENNVTKLVQCLYFSIYQASGNGSFYSENSFMAITCVDGQGEINGISAQKGETFFVPAKTQLITSGSLVFLISGVGL